MKAQSLNIPLVFSDATHYRRTFEPLLMEEARGSLKAECAPAKEGVFHLTLRPTDRGHAVPLREGAIAVLIRPSGPAAEQQQQQQQAGGPAPGLAAAARAAVFAGKWSQGPPGTGKTHTVRGILNTWHSIMYHRHHAAWLRAARDALARSAAGGAAAPGGAAAAMLDLYCGSGGVGNGGAATGILASLEHSPLDAPKPRILVCAPSNAATDELLDRILTDGFADFGGATYRPNVVRVGAEEAPLSEAVKAVWTEAMMNRYEALGAEGWALAYKECEGRIANCDMYMASMAARMAARGKGREAADGGVGGEGDGAQDLDRMAADLVRLNDHLNRAREEMKRLDVAADLATQGSSSLPGFAVRRIREDLELSLMEEAEMVFTTLSSTGRAVFSRLGRGFDFVLIDEAAQASEIAALQPLLYGCRKLVMVGDPQQLPATLFSSAAKETLLERSLFERLSQAGTAVKMLSVQYRMHPEIRDFPSRYFYGNRLQDGESVLRAAASVPPYYAANLLKPYVVYDVSGGREMLQGRSRSNEAEADLALGLYLELLGELRGQQGLGTALADASVAAAAAAAAAGATAGAGIFAREPSPSAPWGAGGAAAGAEGAAATAATAAAAQSFAFVSGYTGPVSVGVITPYRAQRELIRRKFGKQLDVIIFSCVRTARPGAPAGGGGAGGVGFLADVRRMNVAITRAKQALWVLGQFAALRREPAWAALLEDAEARGGGSSSRSLTGR
ncbi:hypothetical protein GPECTOR_1g883 [Gonium pectorale]|uniref:DNA2/NAM7 helicase-like C-terminal domain-containing protein n=1 Tax=Gonium pectorale TaxID=33097 RepID=A0A150H567_GONPE|nr:hypothetical protein GPECTOR_1g883 [Gonium pectorale]|eukprot:KXZ56978.1 hypothetical protein GPECTOR_1g883 [Gonium pectorale]